MNILIFNWRDIKNPSSGGAERLTHEMAKRWVKWRNEVTQISSAFLHCKEEEVVDGVRIIRIGAWWSVHVLASFYYLRNLRGSTDIIIDEVHWFPFFAILYAPTKTVLLVCEVANKLFFKLFPYPLALLGRAFEKAYLFLYRSIPTLAISPSTKKDLVREGFPKHTVTILPMGVSVPKALKTYPKEVRPTVLYVGRLNKQKGIDDAIEAFRLIKKELPKSVFWIIGGGETSFVARIKRKVRRLLPSGSVYFFGFVSEREKFKLLAKAHILLFPSIHEGWGLVLVETGIVGTPAVAYDVSGVRDIVKNRKNGLMVEPNPQSLAQAAVQLLQDDKLYKNVQEKAKTARETFTWEETAKAAFEVLRRRYEAV